jgi:branched-subunit amino acid transport protein
MTDYLVLLIGMGMVTYLPRWIPLHFLSRRSLPEWFIQWLELIPAAILSALLLPALISRRQSASCRPDAARVVGGPAHIRLRLVETLVGRNRRRGDAAVLAGGQGDPVDVDRGRRPFMGHG